MAFSDSIVVNGQPNSFPSWFVWSVITSIVAVFVYHQLVKKG